MNNGTFEADLNAVIDCLYNGLNDLARYVREGRGPEEIAARIEQLAFDFCRRWPICAQVHGLVPEPVELLKKASVMSQKKGPGKSQKKAPVKSQKKGTRSSLKR